VWIAIGLVLGLAGAPAHAAPSAQTTPLAQIARSLDGNISVRLPQGWMSQNTAASIFTSALAFGDTAASLQSIQNSLTGATDTVPGAAALINGVIALVNPQLTAGLSSDLAINALLQGIVQDQAAIGGQVTEQQSLLLGGMYPASLIVVANQAQNATGIVVVFQTQLGIGEAMIGATPTLNYQTNRQLMLDVLNSIRIPGEAANSLPAAPTAIPQAQPAQGQTAPTTRLASIRLPEGWVSQQADVDGFSELTAFSDNPANMRMVLDLVANGGDMGAFRGIAGILGVVDLSQAGNAAPETFVAPLMAQLVASVQGESVQIIEAAQAHTFGGQYAGQLALTSLATWGCCPAAGRSRW
jgi:hypothetical protein